MSCLRHTYLVLLAQHRREAHNDEKLITVLSPADIRHNALVGRDIINPLKAFRVIIQLIKSLLVLIQGIQILHISVKLLILLLGKLVPVDALFLPPLVVLSKILPHKEKLLARMGVHKTISCTEV